MSSDHDREPAPAVAAWPGLLLAPMAALGSIFLGHAMVTPGCAAQDTLRLHAVIVVALATAVASTAWSWHGWRRGGAGRPLPVDPGDAGDPAARDRFVGLIGTMVGAFFSLVIVGQWIAQWMLSPCLH